MENLFTSKPIDILLVEDNPGDARLIEETIKDKKFLNFHLKTAEKLSDGLKYLSENNVDIILLDLMLPDCKGLDTLEKTYIEAPNTPIVVLTGHDDETISVQALRKGAQDFLVKGKYKGDLLLRSLRYAIERTQMMRELEQVRQQEEQEKEITCLERITGYSKTAVTANLFGMKPLSATLPDEFNALVKQYSDLIDLSLEQRVYRIDNNISDEVRKLAEQLGYLNCGPRDVIEMHSTSIKRKIKDTPPAKIKVVTEEGRLILLEIMGYMIAYYRKYSMGVRKIYNTENPIEESIKEQAHE